MKRTTQEITLHQALAQRLLDMGLKKADVAATLQRRYHPRTQGAGRTCWLRAHLHIRFSRWSTNLRPTSWRASTPEP